MATDLIDNFQQRIQARLRELSGSVAEYERLNNAMAALGNVPSSGDGASAKPRRKGPGRPPGKRSKSTSVSSSPSSGDDSSAAASAPATRRKRKAGKRAPRGANRQAILKALEASKGELSVGDVASASGVGRVSADQILKKLQEEGAVSQRQETNGRKRAVYKITAGGSTKA